MKESTKKVKGMAKVRNKSFIIRFFYSDNVQYFNRQALLD